MTCPECSIEMDKVKTESNYGIPIVLNQCHRCGGLWFRDLQLFQVKISEAEKIDAVSAIDLGKLKQNVVLSNHSHSCPSDGTPLEVFHDPGFPKSLQIESCPKCGGFWLNRGEFQEFQKERLEQIESFHNPPDIVVEEPKKESEFDKKMKAILAEEKKKDDNYGSLGNLGNFLMSPVDSSGKVDPLLDLNQNSPGALRPNDVANFAIMSIRLLFSMFLR